MLIECKRIYVHIDKLFAAALLRIMRRNPKQMDKLGSLPGMPMRSLTFAYYWLKCILKVRWKNSENHWLLYGSVGVLRRFKAAKSSSDFED